MRQKLEPSRAPCTNAVHRTRTTTLEELIRSSAVSDDEVRQCARNIVRLLDLLEKADPRDNTRLAKLEWQFLPLLQHDRPARTLHAAMAGDPTFFVELISLMYKPHRAAGTDAVPDDQRARSELAARLLHNWKRPPGLSLDGRIDSAALATWIIDARSLAAKADRAIVADVHIGGVLSHLPAGSDGIWPHEAIREVVEGTASEDLEQGIRLGLYNNRGMVTRAFGEGGTQERNLATSYRHHAEALADQWPRTSRLLREIAEMYEQKPGGKTLVPRSIRSYSNEFNRGRLCANAWKRSSGSAANRSR